MSYKSKKKLHASLLLPSLRMFLFVSSYLFFFSEHHGSFIFCASQCPLAHGFLGDTTTSAGNSIRNVSLGQMDV